MVYADHYHLASVPGTNVTAYLYEGVEDVPTRWAYSLWEISQGPVNGPLDPPLASGAIDFNGIDVTPDQVARVAFLLELELNNHG